MKKNVVLTAVALLTLAAGAPMSAQTPGAQTPPAQTPVTQTPAGQTATPEQNIQAVPAE